MNEVILYQKKRTGKLWQWACRSERNRVITTYGYVDGALQETSESAKQMHSGQSNMVTAEEQAENMVRRKITKKVEAGYSWTKELADAREVNMDVVYADMDKSFTPSKPKTSISPKALKKLWDSGKAIVQRKFDGMCHFVVRHEGGVSILSRGKLEDQVKNFPHLEEIFMHLPEGTILNGELCFKDRDDLRTVSSICRNKSDVKAQTLQTEHGSLHYVVFDVLHGQGEDVTSLPYEERLVLYDMWFQQMVKDHKDLPLDYVTFAYDHAKNETFEDLFGEDNIAQKRGWEGFVVWDKKENTEISWDGKAARKNCFKVKTTYTEDVYVDNPYEGNGRNEGALGGVRMRQIHNGEIIEVGNVGGGYSKEQREEFWANKDIMFPCVVEVECASRFSESMVLQFPVFVRLHPDKTRLEECEVQLMPR